MITFEKLQLVKELHYWLTISLELFLWVLKNDSKRLTKKLKAFDADSKAKWKINFKRNLDRGRDVDGQIENINSIMLLIFFVTEEAKETMLDSSQGTVKVFLILFLL